MKKYLNENKYYLGLEGELIKAKKGYPVKIGFIGCGSHAFRNVYPCLRFLPVDLMAVCDINKDKADLFKRQFGARRSYTDYRDMLANEELDAVMIVVGFGEDGSPLYFPIVNDVLMRGIPVWFEKPPARNASEVKKMICSARKGKTFAQVGFKKMFMPSVDKARNIINSKEFGKISTYTLRYPVDLPSDIRDIESAGPRRFLDDFVHIASTIISLVGRPDRLFYKRSENNGAIATLVHNSGRIGSIHLCPGASEMCPLEQLEIVGEGANVIINNNIEITYYPPSKRLPYGRTESFIPSNGHGAEYFLPEFSLGQLYNKGLFLLGYTAEIREFIISVHDKREPKHAGLEDALAVMQLYDAFAGGEGKDIEIGSGSIRTKPLCHSTADNKTPRCPNCKEVMFLKDGWNYNCKKCGRMIASSELK
jgi:predicted dehydrogenase